jgi:hypothetical protein
MAVAAMFIQRDTDFIEILKKDRDQILQKRKTDPNKLFRQCATRYFCRLDMACSRFHKKQYRRELIDQWNITDERSARTAIDWTKKIGHQREYTTLRLALEKIKSIDDLDLSRLGYGHSLTPEKRQEIMAQAVFIMRYQEELGDSGILAWDTACYIHILRLSYLAGYIKAEQAWTLALEIKPRVQRTFRSWNEFGRSFLVGRFLATGQPDESLGTAVAKLIKEDLSPWNYFGWHQR